MDQLNGLHVLVVEDEPLVALDVAAMIEAEGGLAVGPYSTLGDALIGAEAAVLDAAVLDVNLGAVTSFPVARYLRSREVPFLFYTALSTRLLSEEWSDAPIVLKPALPDRLTNAIANVVSGSR